MNRPKLSVGRTMFLTGVGITGVLIAGAVSVPAASARPPQHLPPRIESGSFVDTQTCGFPITFVFRSKITDTIYFDKSGTPVRERFHVQQPSLDERIGFGRHSLHHPVGHLGSAGDATRPRGERRARSRDRS